MIYESSHIDSKDPNTSKAQKRRKTLLKQSMWRQWFNCNFTKLREYIVCAKTTKQMTSFNNLSIKNILICVVKTKEGLPCLEGHESEQLIIKFSFLGELPL